MAGAASGTGNSLIENHIVICLFTVFHSKALIAISSALEHVMPVLIIIHKNNAVTMI